MSTNLAAPMNDANEIDTQSLLFGFLAEYAQRNRFAVTINRYFKESGDNAMCIPMNIRPDDIYFTVAGLRESKLNGVAIGTEYVEGVVEQLQHQSDEVKACGFCDTITIKNKELYGDVATGRAIALLLRDKGVKKLALWGSGKLARSIVLHIAESGIDELVLINDRIESCMTLMQEYTAELAEIKVDIDRVTSEQEIDLEGYDAFINATPSDAKVRKLAKGTLLIDLKAQSNLADYASVYGAEFVDNERYSKAIARINYDIWINKRS